MANTPFGLLPRRRADGMTANFQTRPYNIPASDGNVMAAGDVVVKTSGTADANGVPSITLATAGGRATGVIVGFIPQANNVSLGAAATKVRPAGVQMIAMVSDDPETQYEVQENSSGGTALPVTAVGKNANFIYAAPNTYFGTSGTQLDTTSVATTATLSLSIIEFEQRPDVLPGTTYSKVVVRLNNHTEAPGPQAGI